VGQLHSALARRGEELEADSRLTLIGERLRGHLQGSGRGPVRARGRGHSPAWRTDGPPRPVPVPDPAVARRLRELLDERVVEGLVLAEAAGLVQAHPAHLVRAFSGAYGIAPHQYLTARRVDLARRLLLDGRPRGDVATAAGFYDQARLTRHFRKLVGVTPGRYAQAPTSPPAAS
jgi:AraC-like DNA-binding protein